LRCSGKNLAYGVLAALRQNCILDIADEEQAIELPLIHSEHLVVCEKGNDLSEVIAANYAYALNADLILIPEPDRLEHDEILEKLYSLYEVQDQSPSAILSEICLRLKQLTGVIPVPPHGSISFIGSLPYGLAYNEVPTTHLFKYPDLGLSIINGFSREQKTTRGTNVAVLVDPSLVAAPEIKLAADCLSLRGIFSRVYQGAGAKVYEITQAIDHFPYDILVLASHCGDTGGYRWKYEFTDSNDKRRQLIVHKAIGVGDPNKSDANGEDLLWVTELDKFHSLDGVLWSDPEFRTKVEIGTALADYIELVRAKKIEPTEKNEIPRVNGSSAIRLFDNNYLGMVRDLKWTPIVICNACCSWHNLASRFMFAGSRSYIGTLFPVTDLEASEVLSTVLSRHFDKTLPHAFWSAQNKVYQDSKRRPYIVTGVYNQRLRVTVEDVPRRLLKLLKYELNYWRQALSASSKDAASSTDFQMTNMRESIEFYQQEVKNIEKNWFD
jgi:hypothetical protein